MESGASLFAQPQLESLGKTGTEVVSGERSNGLTQTRRSSQAELRPVAVETAVTAESANHSGHQKRESTANGRRTGANDRTPMESVDSIGERACKACGKLFTPKRIRLDRPNKGQFCSRKYQAASRRGIRPACVETFITPPSTKAERVRANGLVNKRLRNGWFTRPTHCQKCGRKAKCDGHHEDYMKPGYVAYVCRSCHMKVHQNADYLRGVEGINTDIRQDGKPIGHGRIHHKGGRKGPTGKAKGIAPFNRVVAVENNGDGTVGEILSCGHRFTRAADRPTPKQRRCPECPRRPAVLAMEVA